MTVDRESGRLRRLVDHRDGWYDLWPDRDPARLTCRIETAFDQYGTATAPRPAGDVGADLGTRARGFLVDLFTY